LGVVITTELLSILLAPYLNGRGYEAESCEYFIFLVLSIELF